MTCAITLSVNGSPGSFRRSAALRSSSENCITCLFQFACQLSPQFLERAVTCTLHRVHRHVQEFCDFARTQLFLVAQKHHHPLFFWKLRHRLAQSFVQKRVCRGRSCRNLLHFLQGRLASEILSPAMVDAAMHRRPPQPVRQVRRGLNGRKSLVELQENLLSQDFGRSEEHTSELQSLAYLVCRLLLEKKKKSRQVAQNTT